MPGAIAAAYVEIKPDFSGFEQTADRGMREAMSDVERLAEKAGEAIEGSFKEAATQSDAHLDTIGGADVFSEIGTQADKAGEHVERAFKEAAVQSDKHLSSIGDSAGKGFGKIAGLLAGLGIGAIGTQMVKFGLDTAGSLEQSQVAFEGLLHSADDAKKMVSDLSTFAAKTPFELPGLTTMAQNLLATGKGFGVTKDNVLDFATTIGNAASALGQGQASMDGVTRALGQMSGLGRVSAGDMNQLANALPGFNAWQAVADSMGLPIAKVRELSEQGKLTAEQGIPALIKGMENINGAAGAMERQSLTLVGVLSTFKDTAGQALASGLQPLLEGLKSILSQAPLLDALKGAFTAFGQVAAQLFAAVGPALTQALNLLADVLSTLAPIIADLAPLVGPLVGVFGVLAKILAEGLLTVLDALAPVIKQFADFLNVAADQVGGIFLDAIENIAPILADVGKIMLQIAQAVLPVLGDLFDTLGPIIGQLADVLAGALGDALQALAPSIITIAQLFGDLAKQALPIFAKLIEKLAPIIVKMADVIGTTLARALQILEPIVVKVLDAFAPLIPMLGDVLLHVMETLAPLILKVVEALAPLIPILADALMRALTALEPLLIVLVDALGQIAGAILDALMPLLPVLADLLVKLIDALIPLIPPLIQLIEAILPVLVELINLLAPVLQVLAEIIADVLVIAVNVLIEATKKYIEIATIVWTFIGEKLQPAIDALGGIISWVKDRFDEWWAVVKWGWDNVLSPLVNFFKSGLEKEIEVLGKVVSAIKDGFQKWWDVVSWGWNNVLKPLADFLGGAFSKAFGLASDAVNGLKDVFGKAFDAIKTAVNTAMDFVKKAINTVLKAWNAIEFKVPEVNVGPIHFGGQTIGLPDVPLLAQGMIATRPTVGVFAEAGPEAVIPLTNPKRAQQLMDVSGLSALGKRSIFAVDTMVLQHPVDVDLLMQKAGAAVALERL